MEGKVLLRDKLMERKGSLHCSGECPGGIRD